MIGSTEPTTGTPASLAPASAIGGDQDLAWGVLRRGVLAALALALGSVLAALISWALMLAVLFAASAVFAAADYTAARLGGATFFLPPRAALIGIYGFAGLALTMLIASF